MENIILCDDKDDEEKIILFSHRDLGDSNSQSH
jgi:hypothetical protein